MGSVCGAPNAAISLGVGWKHFVPKGLQDSAWGFNPRNMSTQRPRPEGAEDICDRRFIWSTPPHPNAPVLPPLRGGRFINLYLGLKPQGASCSPFGTKSYSPPKGHVLVAGDTMMIFRTLIGFSSLTPISSLVFLNPSTTPSEIAPYRRPLLCLSLVSRYPESDQFERRTGQCCLRFRQDGAKND
jgi:hypothetical protein